MNHKIQTNKTNGFTLIELLIGMTFVSIIFLAVSSLLFSLTASNTRVTQTNILEQTKHDLLSDISSKVRWAKTVTLAPDGSGFSLTDTDNKTQVYAFTGTTFTRDGVSLTPADVELTSFSVEDLSTVSGLVSLSIRFNLKHKTQQTLTDTLHIVVSQRKTSVSYEETGP